MISRIFLFGAVFIAGSQVYAQPQGGTVIGAMDYTPVTFTNSQHPPITSFAHALALSVLFENGLQHMARRPAGCDGLQTWQWVRNISRGRLSISNVLIQNVNFSGTWKDLVCRYKIYLTLKSIA